jgi:hypothetical protein
VLAVGIVVFIIGAGAVYSFWHKKTREEVRCHLSACGAPGLCSGGVRALLTSSLRCVVAFRECSGRGKRPRRGGEPTRGILLRSVGWCRRRGVLL